MSERKKQSFEENSRRLEEIVEKLEDEQLPLEESIKLFTEGVDLAMKARAQLEDGEKRVQKLIKLIEGDFQLEDFEQGQ